MGNNAQQKGEQDHCSYYNILPNLHLHGIQINQVTMHLDILYLQLICKLLWNNEILNQ